MWTNIEIDNIQLLRMSEVLVLILKFCLTDQFFVVTAI